MADLYASLRKEAMQAHTNPTKRPVIDLAKLRQTAKHVQ
jgi:hypothetical protein